MKTKALFALAALITLGLTGPALAVHFETPVVTGDCEGWTVDVDLTFGSVATEADVDWEFVLSQDSTPVETITGMATVYNTDPHLSLSGTWSEELCGDYTPDGTLHLELPPGTAMILVEESLAEGLDVR